MDDGRRLKVGFTHSLIHEIRFLFIVKFFPEGRGTENIFFFLQVSLKGKRFLCILD
jgi:hypothetical protein